MRKKLFIAAIAAMCFSCTACGFESDLPEQQEEIREETKKETPQETESEETPQVNEIEIVELPSVDAPSYLEFASEEIAKFYQMCRKTPCFSYGDIRHVHRIYASN